jgi:hypothetical protein
MVKNGLPKKKRLLPIYIGTKEIYCRIQVDTNVKWFKEEIGQIV